MKPGHPARHRNSAYGGSEGKRDGHHQRGQDRPSREDGSDHVARPRR